MVTGPAKLEATKPSSSTVWFHTFCQTLENLQRQNWVPGSRLVGSERTADALVD